MARPTSAPQAEQNEFGYKCPTETDVLRELERLVEAEEAKRLWHAACDSFGVDRPGPPLKFSQLVQAAEWLKQQSGLAKIVGNSLSIRLRSYRAIRNSQ
jgi:hypothetical protein